MHRDLKPENILIGADGHLKLTDFGLSETGLKKMLDRQKVNSNNKKKRIVGTADYIAPEIVRGEEVTYLADFWSLGVLGFEFLTGNLLFNAQTQDEILILKTQGRGFKSPVDRRGPDRGLLLGAVCYGGTNLLGCRLQILQIEEQ